MSSCGAPEQTATSAADVEGTDQVVVAGRVSGGVGSDGVPGAFVRLLNGDGEFTAEVVSAPTGDFRFYAAPGSWTVRALHKTGSGQAEVVATGIGLHRADIVLA
ncbi:DUF1416 domain-containing protein [Actinoalloteichus hymeniacidonis]|uniref:DUF1416 family protein n=1 Tax=Actinoalloteichus hymeniacidonis TaxID=340345 RepID=A0AAC9N1A8_9PSEU|nr:DUF1416 domain-containing protein [Actinoalloteichus hymeniacidonis]AOS65957.1 putative DUF1416 family protein [Actinoalloteichus hymeniacidonis]MBB5905947.1 hypothetical protein [Actinoalloteichus hymeniacidonis]